MLLLHFNMLFQYLFKIDNSLINKENFNIKELFPKIFNQYMVMPIITSINYENLKIDQNIIDYFVDYLEKNIPLKGKNFDGNELIQNNNSIRGNYRLLNEINLSARVSEAIKSGLEKGYYRVQSYKKKD